MRTRSARPYSKSDSLCRLLVVALPFVTDIVAPLRVLFSLEDGLKTVWLECNQRANLVAGDKVGKPRKQAARRVKMSFDKSYRVTKCPIVNWIQNRSR